MTPTQLSGIRPVHQTVAPALEFKFPSKSIAVEFTEQRLSPHVGTFFVGWLRSLDWITQVAYLHWDSLAPELLGIKRVASPSAL